MRRAARADTNQAEVIAALRRCGWYAHDTHALGGFVDLVIARAGRLELLEIKDGEKPLCEQALTPAEAKTHAAFAAAGVTVRLVRSIQDALAL